MTRPQPLQLTERKDAVNSHKLSFYFHMCAHLQGLAQKKAEWIEQKSEVQSAENPISPPEGGLSNSWKALAVFGNQVTSRNKEETAMMYSVNFGNWEHGLE